MAKMTRLTPLLAALVTAFVVGPTTTAFAGDSPAAASATSSAVSRETTATELDGILASIVDGDVEKRRTAAKAAKDLGPDAVPAIAKKLAELRKTSVPPTAIAASVKQAKEVGSKPEIDLCEVLLAMPPDGPSYKIALGTATLIRALAHVGTTPALKELVHVAGDHGGAFRTELARVVRLLGDKAVPALIETRNQGSSERHWAFTQLEAMGKRIPGDAVQTKDNQVLADVLRAYATVHDLDALPVILSFVSSDRMLVRAAARDALLKYGQDAIWKLREAYTNLTSKTAPDTWSAADVARELFAAYDHVRLQEVYGLLEEGLAKEKEGKLDEAVRAFDKVLARQPMIDRRGEMVSAYVAHADLLSPNDRTAALAVYRKAARLAPEGPRIGHIQAEIAFLEGQELLARGIADAEPFKRALQFDPTHTKARSELERLETDAEERQARLRQYAGGAAVLVLAILGIIVFGGRRRPRRAARA